MWSRPGARGLLYSDYGICQRSARPCPGCEMPFLPGARVSALGESVPERAQAVFAAGGERPFLVERQRQGTHIGIAAGEGDDLSVQLHELVQGGRGGGKP